VLIVNCKISTPSGARAPAVNLESGLLIGSAFGFLLMRKFQDESQKSFNNFIDILTEVFQKSMTAIINTCAVVGFGAVVRQASAFPVIIGMITNVPGFELLSASLAMYFIAGITGSASGALGLGAGIIADAYPAIAPAIMHRALAIASATFDSLPHNGYIITVTNSICNETYKDAYGAVFKITVIPPVIGSLTAIVLFTVFPELPLG
jgi:H+/gluconate symporter-like permease